MASVACLPYCAVGMRGNWGSKPCYLFECRPPRGTINSLSLLITIIRVGSVIARSPLFAPLAGTGFQSRSTNVKPQKAGFPKLRRCHGSTSPSLANMHIPSQCHQVVSVFGFFLRFPRLFMFFLSSPASNFRFLLFVFHSISFVFSFM